MDKLADAVFAGTKAPVLIFNIVLTNFLYGTFLYRQESTAKKLSTGTALTNQL